MNRRLFPAALVAALATVLGAACGAKSTTPTTAVIALDREPIVLNAAYVGTQQSETLQILNQGRGTLTVKGVQLQAPGGGALPGGTPLANLTTSDPLPAAVAGLGATFVRFTYAPKVAGRTSAQLVIDSDDPARPHIVTPLSACAVQLDGGGASCACPDGGPSC